MNQRGFSVLDTMLGVALVVVIGVAGYFAYANFSKHRVVTSVSSTSKAAASPTASPSPTPQQTSMITPSDGSPLRLVIPAGWTAKDNNLSATIGGVGYRIGFQITPSDWLKGTTYGGDATLMAQTKTSLGTAAYIVKSKGNVALSSCKPESGFGCSMVQNGKPLFVTLYPYKAGDQAMDTIDFSDASASKAVAAFTSVVESLGI